MGALPAGFGIEPREGSALRYAPEFRLRIARNDVPAALRGAVTSVRFQEGMNAADRVEIGLANVNLRWLQQHIRGLGTGAGAVVAGLAAAPLTGPALHGVHVGSALGVAPTPEGLFDLDNELTLAIGYADAPLDDVFDGEITGVEASFPGGGMPTMTLVAHDYLHRLAEGTYARGFGPLPDFLIAAILGVENRLIPIVGPFVRGASTALAAVNVIFNGTGRKQRAETHLELLTRIAATYDADFWVEGDVLYLTRFAKEYSPRLTLTWGESLLDFAPSVSSVGQAAGVAMKFTLREVPLDFLVTVFWDFDRERLGVTVTPGAAVPAGKSSKSVFTIVNRPIGSPADITNSALAIVHELRGVLNKRLTATGSAVGDPRIRAGAMLRIDGIGPDFSGNYRVGSAVHSIDAGGYRTTFEVFREIIP